MSFSDDATAPWGNGLTPARLLQISVVPGAAPLLLSSRRRLAALGLSAAALLACGSPNAEAPSAAQLRQPLSGARVERNYSGALALITVTPERVELCTATLLTPNLVATARHCVAPTPEDSVRCAQGSARFGAPHEPEQLWLHRERQLRNPLGSYGLLPVTGGGDELVAVAEVFVPETPRICGGDLALLLLEEPLDASDAEPLVPRLDTPVQHGELYTAVGFGATPDPGEQGVRRSREGLQVTCTPEECPGAATVEDTEFRGGDGVCSGDSGGPAIDVEGRVTGVASRSVGCTGSVYSAFARWRGFIREVAALATREGDHAEPEWLHEAPSEPDAPEEEGAAEPSPLTGDSDPNLPEADPPSDVVAIAPESEPLRAASTGDGGCSTTLARDTRWQPLALLLGVALAARRTRSRRAHRPTT